MTKARWPMKCECCGENIATGSHFVNFHGRPWKSQHVIAYKQQRTLTGGAGKKRD